MPSHEQDEQFFMEFAREMADQGHFIMDDYKHDWVGLPTEDQLRDQQVENQHNTDESDEN